MARCEICGKHTPRSRHIEIFAVMLTGFGVFYMGFWLGLGSGIAECAAASVEGYTHKLLGPGTHAECALVQGVTVKP